MNGRGRHGPPPQPKPPKDPKAWAAVQFELDPKDRALLGRVAVALEEIAHHAGELVELLRKMTPPKATQVSLSVEPEPPGS